MKGMTVPTTNADHERGVQWPLPTLLVFSDDWGRHPSSCQHLIKNLLDRWQVLWVNTIGTRSPQWNLATLKRGWEKIRHWTKPVAQSAPLPSNLRVINPRMWPGFNSRWSRALNQKLLLSQLSPILKQGSGPVTALTTLPIVADLVGPLPVQRWVYYCVDDFSLWPGLDQRAMALMDEQLIRRVDARLAVSTTLQQKLEKISGQPVQLLTHGVDLDFWQTSTTAKSSILDHLPRPVALFWGVIDRRLDVDFLKHLCLVMKSGSVVLVGPQDNPDPLLDTLPRLHVLPAVTFEQLPALAQSADVLIMPYADLPVTRAMQPLKLKEYLATGKPVVVRDLPANREWAEGLDLVATPEEFTTRVSSAIHNGLQPQHAQARHRLQSESWSAKALELQSILQLVKQ